MPKKKRKNPTGSILLMGAGVFLILGALGWYLFSDAGITGTQLPPPTQSGAGLEGNFPNIERVSPHDAKTAYDQNLAVFIDVRDMDEYAQERIPGALNIPLLDLPGRVGELNPDDWFITY